MRKLIPLFAVVLVGCSGTRDPGSNPDPVEISGTVSVGGKVPNNVTLNLQATGSGTPATFLVKNGQFKGKATPGKYTYFISEGPRPSTISSVPAQYLAGSMERQINVASGSKLTLKLD